MQFNASTEPLITPRADTIICHTSERHNVGLIYQTFKATLQVALRGGPHATDYELCFNYGFRSCVCVHKAETYTCRLAGLMLEGFVFRLLNKKCIRHTLKLSTKPRISLGKKPNVYGTLYSRKVTIGQSRVKKIHTNSLYVYTTYSLLRFFLFDPYIAGICIATSHLNNIVVRCQVRPLINHLPTNAS